MQNRWLREQLYERFQDEIEIHSSGSGSSGIVTFKKTTRNIVRSLYKHKPSDALLDEEKEKQNILVAAAELIQSEIKSIERQTDDIYPSLDEVGDIQKVNPIIFYTFAYRQWFTLIF